MRLLSVTLPRRRMRESTAGVTSFSTDARAELAVFAVSLHLLNNVECAL